MLNQFDMAPVFDGIGTSVFDHGLVGCHLAHNTRLTHILTHLLAFGVHLCRGYREDAGVGGRETRDAALDVHRWDVGGGDVVLGR